MNISFFYCGTDYSVNDLSIVYDYLHSHKDRYCHHGLKIHLIDVNKVTLHKCNDLVKVADVVVVDILVRKAILHEKNKFPYNTIMANKRDDEHYLSIYNLLSNAPTCKIFWAQSFDLHWHGIDIDSLKNFNALFWLYEKQPTKLELIPTQYCEDWFSQHEDHFEVWQTITQTCNSRAEIPFCVRIPTFGKLPRKLWDYVTPGCDYQTRLIANRYFSQTNLRAFPYNKIDALIGGSLKLLNKQGFFKENTLNYMNIWLRKRNYNFAIERSRLSFACGSGLRYPVRKFFQIPSLGSLLLAYPCVGFGDYGFENGINCIEVSPETAANEAQRILQKPSKLEKMIQESMNLILRRHTTAARISQIIECIKRVYSGKIINAQFFQGNFEISDY